MEKDKENGDNMTEKLEIYMVDHDGVHEQVGVDFFTFPAGEIQLGTVPSISPTDFADSYVVLRSTDVTDILKANLWSSYCMEVMNERPKLYVPYLPASRSDKGATHASSTYNAMLKAGAYSRILTMDVHSLQGLTSGVRSVQPTDAVIAATMGKEYDVVIAPDAGAKSRAAEVARRLGVPLCVAQKARDQATGEIISYQLDITTEYDRALVVDDICDGGATFLKLADAIAQTVTYVDLWVTHGVFSKGTDVLTTAYDTVYTTDSIVHDRATRQDVVVVPVMPFIRQ